MRRDGWKVALPKVGQEIVQLPYRRLRFYLLSRQLDIPLPDLQPGIELMIRPFVFSDLAAVHEIDRPSESRSCAERLAHGQYGLAAVHAGKVVGVAWGASRTNSNMEKVISNLEPGDILCNDAYTAPEFRGKGIQTALTLARFRRFRDLGYRRAICYIEIQNSPSLAVWQRKFGAQIAGEIDFLRVGLWYRVRYVQNPDSRKSHEQHAAAEEQTSRNVIAKHKAT